MVGPQASEIRRDKVGPTMTEGVEEVAAAPIAVADPLVRPVPWWGKVPWLPLILLSPMLVFGLFGQWLMPHDPTLIDFTNTQRPPAWLAGGSWSYPLGTDNFGRDLLSTLIDGAYVPLIVAIVGVFGAALIGITLGMVAGYFGGWVDALLMQLVDVKMSIPATLLIILIGSAIGAGLPTILSAIVFLFWASYARVVRGQVLSLRERGYIALARVANCSNFWILTRHILPNVLSTCIVLVTLQFGGAIMIEAGISFLGLGVQPPASTWGLMVSGGRTYLGTAWWMPVFPGIAITMTVMGANLFGDWLRDTLQAQSKA